MTPVFRAMRTNRLVWSRYLYARYRSTPQIEQFAEVLPPSRKVRTPQGTVVGNADPGKPAGKCHRNHTAHVPKGAGKVEMVR